jgi:hypothetical protein
MLREMKHKLEPIFVKTYDDTEYKLFERAPF